MIKLLSGDCRDVLATLPAESVHCVVCSPPYYGLRDYGTALWDGGDANCPHTFDNRRPRKFANSRGEGINDKYAGTNCTSWTHRDATPPRQCACGAVRVDRQIGLEATPDEYLATMVGVFREVRRVLRRDGTCWANMGDSYAASTKGSGGHNPKQDSNRGSWMDDRSWSIPKGLKPKDLLLMPARLALALQADGWWVRSDIIWHKPNPMPESVTDRPTSAHEHVFLLTKSARYFYDADAVREENSPTGQPWGNKRNTDAKTDASRHDAKSLNGEGLDPGRYWGAGRSCRNVWTLATESFSGAHFATFPSALAERCIKAGTSERGCCAACGKPWVRVTDVAFTASVKTRGKRGDGAFLASGAGNCVGGWNDCPSLDKHITTTGWRPSCGCGASATGRTGFEPARTHFLAASLAAEGCSTAELPTERVMNPPPLSGRSKEDIALGVVPCTVLDPFAGAGTTLLVADRLQRDAIGIELNTAYTEMAMERCRADAPLFTAFPPAEDPEDERMADLFTDMAAD